MKKIVLKKLKVKSFRTNYSSIELKTLNGGLAINGPSVFAHCTDEYYDYTIRLVCNNGGGGTTTGGATGTVGTTGTSGTGSTDPGLQEKTNRCT